MFWRGCSPRGAWGGCSGLCFCRGGGARGGGGVTADQPGPPFLQREKRLVEEI